MDFKSLDHGRLNESLDSINEVCDYDVIEGNHFSVDDRLFKMSNEDYYKWKKWNIAKEQRYDYAAKFIQQVTKTFHNPMAEDKIHDEIVLKTTIDSSNAQVIKIIPAGLCEIISTGR